MEHSSDSALQAAFDAEELERCRRGALTGAMVGLPAMAVFAVYDFTFFPDQAIAFSLMRVTVIVAGALAMLFLYRPGGVRWARPVAFGVCTLLGLSVVAMSVATGGRASPYYGGINIVLLGVAIAVPWTPAWSAGFTLFLIVTYVTGMLASGVVSDTRMFVHNLAFLGSTGVIAFGSTLFQRRMRWQEFRTRTQLQTALAHKRDFLASMSHELRSPLHVIINYAGMLLDDPASLPVPESRQLVDRIRERGVFLHGMISDLLDAAKLDAGRMEVHPGPVAVAALVERVAGIFAPLAAQKDVTLRTEVAADLPVVTTDRLRLEQILSNFVGNAVKFTARGTVTIEARVLDDGERLDGYHMLEDVPASHGDGSAVAIAVRDTGIGIRHEDVTRLAQDFRQLDDAAQGQYGGTGLGLSIARRLATLLGGSIGVRSEYGAGSTFVLVLPVGSARLRAVA